MSLSKKILITGGTKGIGLACSELFYKKGYEVILISRSGKGLLGSKGFKCDVGNLEDCKKVIKEICNDGKPIDCLINSAGIAINAPIALISENAIQSMIATNLLGTINMCKVVSRYMIKQNQGCMINLSSIIGLNGNKGQSVYGATKAGVIGLTKSLAKELGPKNIRVNAITPGFIDTEMTQSLSPDLKEIYLKSIPLCRYGSPNEVADVAWFLSQNAYISGSVVTIDGGLSA